MPLDQALKYAAQICDALDAAHRKGITHRDLKPANILSTKAGIKLLDFGLAKLSTRAQAAKAPNEATLTMALTGKNEIVGTLFYMSPEQLQSQATNEELDGRSDIFSFGLVLYELLTGKRAIEGTSPASVIAAIMERPAPSIADVAPAALDRLLKRCLEKDPDNRWQTARDLKAELEWIATPAVEGSSSASPLTARFKWLWPAVAGLFALVAAAALWAWAERARVTTATTRLSVLVPANRPAIIPGAPTRSLAISPDGTQLVYVAASSDTPASQSGGGSQGHLQLRILSSLEVRDLPGTTGARQPFFSPDGSWVAFFTGSDLRKISLSAGNPVSLAEKISDSANGCFGLWTAEDGIIFGTTVAGLYRVSTEGGTVTTLSALDKARVETAHDSPALVPSSRAVLFTVFTRGTTQRIDAVMPD